MILNLPSPQIEFSANIFYRLLCDTMKNKRQPGDNYKSDTKTLTQTQLFYDLNVLMNADSVSLGEFNLLYQGSRLQGGYKNAASKFNYGAITAARSSIFLLNDTDIVANFDNQVKNSYAAACSKATELARRYFDCTVSARNDKLVRKLLYLILHDNSISNDQSFYVCSDGSVKTKADLGSMTDFEFEAFLLGIWHYLVTTQRLQVELERDTEIVVNSGYQDMNVRLTYSQSVIVPRRQNQPNSGSKIRKKIADAMRDNQNVSEGEQGRKPQDSGLKVRKRSAAVSSSAAWNECDTWNVCDDQMSFSPPDDRYTTRIISIMETSDITLSRSIFFYLLEGNIQTVHPKRDRNAGERLFLDLLKLTVGHDCSMKSDQGLSDYCHDKFRRFQMLDPAHCLDDQVQIDAFSDRLHQNYDDVLVGMMKIREKYFCSEEKNEALVVELIEFICNDNSIAAEQEFMVCSDGSTLTKAELCDAEELEFEPFLLGVWHYVVSQLTSKDSADENTYSAVFRLRYNYNGKDCERYRSGDIINEQSERYIKLYYLE